MDDGSYTYFTYNEAVDVNGYTGRGQYAVFNAVVTIVLFKSFLKSELTESTFSGLFSNRGSNGEVLLKGTNGYMLFASYGIFSVCVRSFNEDTVAIEENVHYQSKLRRK